MSAHTTDHPYANVPLVLISGVGRSGTTALRESIGLHPEIHSSERENNIIYDVLDTALRNCTVQSRRYAMRVTDDEYDGAFRRLLLSLLWPAPRACATSRLLAFSDLTPERADYLVRLFPGVRIIYVVRNGIEVIASRMRYDGFRHQPFDTHAAVWSLAQHMARWGQDRADFQLIRHENVIAEGGPERETGRICDFLEIPFAPGCAENLRRRNYHPTPELKPGAGSAPLASRAQRWRDWSEEQLGIFESKCADAMSYFGYERPWTADGPAPKQSSTET